MDTSDYNELPAEEQAQIDRAMQGKVESSPKNQKKHPLLQWRPKDPQMASIRNAFYSPARDLAYIGPEIVKRAMFALREEQWEPWLKEYLQSQGITEQMLVDIAAPRKLAIAMNGIVSEQSPIAAVENSGFNKLPGAIQLLFYGRIGQVLLAALWSAIKDVSAPDSDPPATLASILAAAEEVLPENFRN